MLMGPEHPVFTAFGQQNPERIIVDLSSSIDHPIEPVMVNDGLVAEVSVSPYSTGTGSEMTRVEVLLEASADHNVRLVPGGMEVRISADRDSAAFDMDAVWDDESQTEAYDPWETGQDEESSDVVEIAPEPTPATRFTGMDVEETSDGKLLKLRADGMISSVMTFTLEEPPRLVIDLIDLENGADLSTRELNSELIYGGSAAEPFDGRRVVPTPSGLMVALGSGEEIDSALEMATEIPAVVSTPVELAEDQDTEVSDSQPAEADAAVEMVAETDVDSELETVVDADGAAELEADSAATDIAQADAESPWSDLIDAPAESFDDSEPESDGSDVSEADYPLAAIYGIEFDGQDNRDRIVVLADSVVEYKLFEPTAETVIVSLKGAKIDPEAAVRITPEAGGPVSLVTAFDQPEMEEPEVRLVVQRAANLEPQISRRGSLLIVDFPHTGNMAAAPPAMTQDQAMGAQAELESVPASIPPTPSAGDVADSQWPSADLDQASSPASLEPESSIDILASGGLSADKQYKGRRISLDFKDVDIADVLRLIAEVSELNVIAGDEVNGKASCGSATFCGSRRPSRFSKKRRCVYRSVARRRGWKT
jgi:type IV pilus assembly protein PilQ